MKTVIRLYTPDRIGLTEKKQFHAVRMKDQPAKSAALVLFIVLQLWLGLGAEPILRMLQQGLQMFA